MRPDIDDVLTDLHVVELPLRRRFRGIERRETALLRGPHGWSEFSPFVEYDDRESSRWLRAAIEFGWEEAPAPIRGRIPVNATVPAVPADDVAEVLDTFPGARTAKVKVAERGSELADDLARVAAVRQALGGAGRIRVDANGAWNVDEAEHAIRQLERFDIEYVEQPCATLDELAELRGRIRRIGIDIAADEGLRKADDPDSVDLSDAADIVIVKAAPLGGIGPALRHAARLGLPVVVSSALETSVGLAMGAQLAAALPDLRFDCGLGTAALLAADVTDRPLLPFDGGIDVRRVEPDPALLERWAASPERTAWWRARIERTHALLAAIPTTEDQSPE
ncbi:o-succinylbenzoate synthase [Herbiconiux sp. L3-i23]|uniref:o-succinylbenzoate synthase n=1 Tax=Herbiconiux sp. L3-i23 TaxID=2905871 RepID=UPI002074A2B4|nr:o-succinylbenzoate synthase [Herbiconiux sp. L3-i23]